MNQKKVVRTGLLVSLSRIAHERGWPHLPEPLLRSLDPNGRHVEFVAVPRDEYIEVKFFLKLRDESEPVEGSLGVEYSMYRSLPSVGQLTEIEQ